MDLQELQETIAGAKNGSPQAYEALLEAYGSRLYGFFLRAVGRHHDAEDLLSEIMLRLVRRLKTYDDRGRFEPWLFRIAANLVRDRIRRLKVRPTAASISPDEDGGGLAARLAGKSDPVDREMLAADAATALHRALDRLEPTTREMIILRHFSEMSFKEIAEMYECPIGTALARVHRGLKALRGMIGDEHAVE